MPIYEYQCSSCQEVSEHLQKMTDPAPETCPACGAMATLTKKVSQSAFHLKGGGWYADAYSSKKPAEKKPEGSANSVAGDKGGDSAAADSKKEKKSKSPSATSAPGKS